MNYVTRWSCSADGILTSPTIHNSVGYLIRRNLFPNCSTAPYYSLAIPLIERNSPRKVFLSAVAAVFGRNFIASSCVSCDFRHKPSHRLKKFSHQTSPQHWSLSGRTEINIKTIRKFLKNPENWDKFDTKWLQRVASTRKAFLCQWTDHEMWNLLERKDEIEVLSLRFESAL